jgi:AcrR family transcriptional regulator
MSPRKYNMATRSAAVEDTRRRIVEATIASHDENESIVDTGIEEIALRADVAPATVRRHFRTRDELVTACGRHVLVDLALPSTAALDGLFAGARSRDERLARVAEALCASYARGELRLAVAYREAPRVPALAAFLSHLGSIRDELARSALGGSRAPAQGVRIASGLTAFPVWKALRDAGLDRSAATDALVRAVCSAAAARPARP